MAMPGETSFMVKYVYQCGRERLVAISQAVFRVINGVISVEQLKRRNPIMTVHLSSMEIPEGKSDPQIAPETAVIYNLKCGHDSQQKITGEAFTRLQACNILPTDFKTELIVVPVSYCSACRSRTYDDLCDKLLDLANPRGSNTRIGEALLEQTRRLHEAHQMDKLVPGMYDQLLDLVAQVFVKYLPNHSMASWLRDEPLDAFFVDDLRRSIRHQRHEAARNQ
ncbi:hypothetical protein E8E14_008515 [Neopestalotiopsis sp. 37M]|nr:hypothetical protein E8E14_008515 [Neopestalotiopsis sp. 37M]